MKVEFEAELWEHQGPDPWVFVTVPTDVAEQINESGAPRSAFGSIRVAVEMGKSRWHTSLFPDRESGSYVLPIKREVRRDEALSIGDTALFILEVAG